MRRKTTTTASGPVRIRLQAPSVEAAQDAADQLGLDLAKASIRPARSGGVLVYMTLETPRHD